MKTFIYYCLFLLCGWGAYAQDPAYPAAPAAAVNITAAEYFIDTDPGIGGGVAVSVAAAADIASLPIAVNVNGLSNGSHWLFLRTRSADGVWSITAMRNFLYDANPAYVSVPSAAQNIIAAECFIDTDPGFGLATAISITPGVDLASAPVTVSTSGLTNGIHRLYIRVKSNEGRWSLTMVKDFAVDYTVPYATPPAAAQNVVAAEYFIDTDPGFGKATAISVTPQTDIAAAPVTINTTGLSQGTHHVYLRTKNAEGSWGITQVKEFIVDANPDYPVAPAAAQNVVAAEYFVDTDPGFGKATAISVTAQTDVANLPVTVNTSGLPLGTHHVYLRTKNAEGSWGITQVKEFIVDAGIAYPAAPAAPLKLAAAEYFIDTDPGFGAGTPIVITPGVDVSNVAVSVNTTGLANGNHQLYVRSKSQEGSWSIVNNSSFFVGQQTASWSIVPATGHDYGAKQTGSSTSFTFYVKNTGTVPVSLHGVAISDPAFSAQYTVNTSIAVGDSLGLPVTFVPNAVQSYTAQLKIIPAAAGPDTVTTTLRGSGFVPGTPPVIDFVSAAPYSAVRGVSAEAGQPGAYTYRIVYKSATNTPPKAGFPKVGIDRNGDQDFLDANEALLSMNKLDTSTNYAAGVTYTLTVNHPDYSSTLGYRFFATDDQGNDATTVRAAYMSGPVITYQLPDLKIFASDISFSKANPLVNEPFTLTANVTNASAYTMNNVPVKFYRDTILLDSAVIPVISAFSSNSVNKTFSFAADGYYPIKVWVDSANTLGDVNMLNNYAIRPVVVGTVTLPGGINVTTSASLQSCPQAVLISGNAKYFGTSAASLVAGAQVTITIGAQTITTTTNSGGDFSFLLQNPVCGGTLSYTAQVTDFTFTSTATPGSIAVPCPAPSACVVTPQPGIAMVSQLSNNPCAKKVGTTGTVEVSVTYRARNLDNFWCAWDQILKDTIKVYQNGVLIQTYSFPDGTTSPGSVRVLPVTITLDSVGPNVIEARQSYVYNEFFNIPDNFYHGVLEPMTGYGSVTVLADATNPDLTIRDYSQTGFTSFTFSDANVKCGDAGSHSVKVFDSIPGSGGYVLIKTFSVSALGGATSTMLSFSDPAMSFGIHHVRIVTDANSEVTEVDENNNVFETTIDVPRPDLRVGVVTLTNSDLPAGGKTAISAHIINTGMQTGPFTVLFRVNGVQVGNKISVTGAPAKDSITLVSDLYTATTSPADCPITIDVV
ncbi:MAG: hypothetical protein JST39_20545, partial [Bacteroidetes bacterium]|nr:hypothetical protein [Bacteroidota bacterium]